MNGKSVVVEKDVDIQVKICSMVGIVNTSGVDTHQSNLQFRLMAGYVAHNDKITFESWAAPKVKNIICSFVYTDYHKQIHMVMEHLS